MVVPTAYRWPDAREAGTHARVRARVKRVTGLDLFPDESVAIEYGRLLNTGDAVAERFVNETFLGALGPERSREMLNRALAGSVDDVPDAPESMRELFADFESVPDWVDRALVEQGAAVWRRWGYTLGSIGNAGTLDAYTEASLAVPLSLSGGYAGDSALNRYLETSRWWIEVCRPGASLTPGSLGRRISMQVRVMHVSVRRRVAEHSEWDTERWGLPISQAEMMLTLLGGSIGPGLGLYALGYITSPAEITAALHFNRYLGHLVGMRSDIFPETIADGIRMLYLFDATRSYDSGAIGAELVESFVPAFAPLPHYRGAQRLRAQMHLHVQAAYTRLFMLPANRRRYRLPSPWLGLAVLLLRVPLIVALEVARRVSPTVDRAWQRASVRAWERWLAWSSQRKPAQFKAAEPLRR
ncbi:MAG: oxygenase MpaB family protein [Mycobacterium sp.]